MDMQSSRRSAPMDRSRDPGPGLKKPRLADEVERDRSFPPPPRFSGGGRPTDPRIRASAPERDRESGRAEREEPGRGGSYEHQHLQELVAQYKTALAELTFNSKPIITNLTIIAGENLQAAKAIAATICANILEVPSEQKLPSLYLLDSIVKNIGRDYIKYFSTRLPEVFCKAYRQVDSSIHPGMRHLFGTWKGVFSLAPLQMIEKELGFPPIVNGSSRLIASKPDSQTRPSHSIHVNPKYLEARQRLQQSTRAQEINNDDTSSALSPLTSAERSDRSAAIGSERQWADLPMKFPNIQRLQREQLSNPVNEKKEHREHEFLSDLSQQSELEAPVMLTKEQDGPDKPWYGSSNAASESHYNTRNGLDVNHVYRNFRESGSTQANCHLSSVQMNNVNNSNQTVSKNWKNSEEEEYMWDDMNSRLADHGGTSSSIKGCQNTDEADRSATGGKWLPMNNKHQGSWWGRSDTYSDPKNSTMEDRVSFFKDIEEHIRQPHQEDIDLRINMEISTDLLSIGRTESGHCASSEWAPHEAPSSVVSLNHTSSTISGNSEGQCISFSSCLATSQCTSSTTSGLPSHSLPSSLGPLTNIVSGSRGTFGQHMPQPLRPASPSACLPPSSATRLHPKSHTSTDHDHLQSHSLSQMGQKPLQASVLLNKPPQASVNQDSFPILAHKRSQQPGSLLNLQKSQQSQLSAASTIVNELRHQLPILQQSQSDPLLQLPLSQSQPSIQAQKPPLLQLTVGSNQTRGFSGTSHVSSLTVDVPGQSSTDNLVAAIMKSGVVPNNLTQNQNVQPPLPSGPPPIHALLSSVPLVTHSSVSLPTSHGNAPSITSPSIRCVLPPLPPGPPPFSSMLGTTMQISNISSAVSNPLSNLLSSLVEKGIINLSTELSSTTSAEKEAIPSNGRSVFASSIKVQVPSTSAALANSPRPLVKELSVLNSSNPVDIDVAESTYTGMEDLIGIDFRPEIVREFHPSVIDSLINDLKHQCITCGLRFKFQEQLQSHSDWHAAKSSKESSLGNMSRKWFVEIGNWVAKSVGEPYGLVCATPIEVVTTAGEKCESMVPADESQCICTLCGEPFEDFYSVERDEWMYKGAVYFELLDRQDETRVIDEIEELVPIIHTRCLSRSCDGMEVAENNQVD